MPVQVLKERNTGKISAVTLGATAAQGGTRTSTITVGGETSLPFLHFEGENPNRPVIAMEIVDRVPDWAAELKTVYSDVMGDVAAWAKKCVASGADMIFLRLQSADPELGNSSVEQCVATVKKVLSAVGVPIAVTGCGIDEVDNKVLAAVAEACAGENLLIGPAKQENYNTVAAACMVHKHTLLTMAPLDINICKQLNILVSEMGMPLDKIIIDPSIGGPRLRHRIRVLHPGARSHRARCRATACWPCPFSATSDRKHGRPRKPSRPPKNSRHGAMKKSAASSGKP